MYVVRRLVESYAMQRVTTRQSPRDMARARSIAEQMQADTAARDVDSFRRDNREFHFFFYERCGLPSLSEQIAGMWHAFP